MLWEGGEKAKKNDIHLKDPSPHSPSPRCDRDFRSAMTQQPRVGREPYAHAQKSWGGGGRSGSVVGMKMRWLKGGRKGSAGLPELTEWGGAGLVGRCGARGQA